MRETEAPAGRIDIFDAEGFFLTEITNSIEAKSITVDTKGNLYVFGYISSEEAKIVRYSPTGTYDPAAGEITYGDPPTAIVEGGLGFFTGLAINPLNDHLYVNYANHVTEYSSAAEGNDPVDETIGVGSLQNFHGLGLAVDAAHGRIYASSSEPCGGGNCGVVQVFELAAPHNLLLTIKGADTPTGEFANRLSIAVDEGSGNVFIYAEGTNAVYEFTSSGTYVGAIEHSLKYVGGAQIAIDNGSQSPNGGLLSQGGRFLYVPSHLSFTGHLFAFQSQVKGCSPKVESVSATEPTESEIALNATINPCNAGTSYVFEYVSQQAFETEGFANASVTSQGTIAAAGTGVSVTRLVTGLSPGTMYRFRVVATNSVGSDSAEGSFTTYPSAFVSVPCPNDSTRTGFSALLPDCRAYELVTPPATNARPPTGVGSLGIYFSTREASPSGNAVSFQIEGGLIPGGEGSGSLGGDPYLAVRGAGGWSTSSAGPTGAEASAVLPGSPSPDQGYSFWSTGGGGGSAEIEGKSTNYVRYPDGHSALIGRGSLGTDPRAEGLLISEGGGHIVFASLVHLEPAAAASGARTIYDRTADEVTHVVSLLPGGAPPADAQEVHYQGSSLDGRGIAFLVDSTLYLRYDNAETYEVGDEVTFAGIAEGGNRVFYLKGGNLFALDVLTGSVIPFSSGGDATVVNVAAHGTAAYFVSPDVLTTEENSNGQKAKNGKQNLYLSQEGALTFVGILTDRDVEGESNGNILIQGLGLWTNAVAPGSEGQAGRFGIDPSRTTPDGRVILFESRASLTGYDSGGQAQVYRYDSASGGLSCLSCNPTGAAATGAASLQSIRREPGDPAPFERYGLVTNLRSDGQRAFFQSTEPLVAADTDGLQDIYEWEAQGVGSCGTPGGCVYLISSGHSARDDYLYAVSDSGDDVFFSTWDLLLPADLEETPSIYDARVGGGFPEGKSEECEGEGCRPNLTPMPGLSSPGTPALGARDNVRKRCPKGKKRVKRHGKVRCVKRHHRKHHHKSKHHRKAGSKGKGAAK
jgi:hypothetical protein